MVDTTYIAYPTLSRFHHDYSKYKMRFVAGPPGSGKSVANVIELLAIAFRQEPAPDKVRYTRFGVIRSTYGELEKTTLKTLETWLPEQYTRINRSAPIKIHVVMPLSDGTKADIIFDLLAVDNQADLKKLDSFEVTAVWLNEMTSLPKHLVGIALERSGRYPPPSLWGDGRTHCTYYGVIGDYNYPMKDHWLVSYLHEGSLPENTMLYEQPPALIQNVDEITGEVTYEINPLAENLANLDDGKKYLFDLNNYLALNTPEYIETRLLCRFGRAGGNGKSIFTNFVYDIHVSKEDLKPKECTNTLISIDTSGIHPCALFWQYYRKQWIITDGIYGEDMGLEEFIADVMTPMLHTRYPGCDILCVCDPANARDARTATTPIDLLKSYGYSAIPAVTNSFKPRIQACEMLFTRRDSGSVLISKHVSMLITSLNGGYQYRRLHVSGIDEVYSTQPIKNKYSHWADAFQYGALHVTSNVMSDNDKAAARRLAKASYIRGTM